MRRLVSTVGSTAFGLGALALSACSGSSIIGGGGGAGGGGTSGTNSTGTGSIPSKVDKVDIVVSVDNSRSMADKQAVLSLALADLVGALTNPPCLDANGIPVAPQPAGPLDACPAGAHREFNPVVDIHVGIISSSLGGHGSDACSPAETQSCNGQPNPSNNDAGHLLSRQESCNGESVPTYQSKGFLAWDPTAKLSPPGITDPADFTAKFSSMVLGAGQVGCGYESQLESWYRFLADPDPHETITIQGGKATPAGTDDVLLAERAGFLRPDSLLAILMLSDEDDCSTKEYGQFFYANQQRNPSDNNKAFHMPRPRQECATNPNDPCCASCGQTVPNCPVDPTCAQSPTLSDVEDDINLRCWDQKRRFGIDFMYPIDRYVTALTSTTVPNRAGELVANPIFAGGRDAGLVVLAAIVGVPWQDVARDPTDLGKGFKTAEELSASQNGKTGWDVILGDPANYVPPLDPLMIESPSPRAGTNPVTGVALAPPSSPLGNPINGNEYTAKHDDLQYACVFPILSPRDCTDGSMVSCDCQDPTNDNPLCEADPMNGGARTLQVRAKAYPGQRELSVLKALGTQGVVSSICPAQTADATKADYAYRPAITALVQRVKARLQ